MLILTAIAGASDATFLFLFGALQPVFKQFEAQGMKYLATFTQASITPLTLAALTSILLLAFAYAATQAVSWYAAYKMAGIPTTITDHAIRWLRLSWPAILIPLLEGGRQLLSMRAQIITKITQRPTPDYSLPLLALMITVAFWTLARYGANKALPPTALLHTKLIASALLTTAAWMLVLAAGESLPAILLGLIFLTITRVFWVIQDVRA